MATVSLTVRVTNVPDAMFTIAYPGAAATVDENEVWTSLAPQLGGDDAPNGTLTWSKSGVDAGDFGIDAGGVLTLPGQDYENPADADQDRQYQVTVTAADADENTATVSLTVTVENVPDAMFTIAYPGAAATVDENEVWTSLAPQLGGDDAPNGTLTWSKSGVDAGDFGIDAAGVLTLPGQDYENPADADQDRQYQVTVTATDADENTATVSLTVTVENVPDAMFTIAYPGAAATVDENEVWTSLAPQLGGDDAPNGTLTWSKSGVDAGDFGIDAAGVLTLPGQDYENPADADQDRQYQVTVTATDADENTATVSLTVTVENVPDAMFTIAYPGAAATVDENEVWTSLAPQLGGDDAPNGTLTWSKSGVDAGDFGIDAASGVLTLPGQDYENPADADQDRQYQVTVTATDADENTATVSLTVTVENVPDAMFTIAYPGAAATVDENEVWTSLAPQLGGDDAPNGTLTWSKSGVDAGDFGIDAASGVLTLPGQDYENPADADQDRQYQVTVTATDADENTATVSLTVTVENVPDAMFTIAYPGAAATVDENEVWTSLAPQLGGDDAPNGTLTWSKSGVDAGDFGIDAASGVLTLPGQDYEDGNTATASLTVTVINVPEDATLTISGLADASVEENKPWTSPTLVLTRSPSGPIGAVTWSKSGADAAMFTLADGDGAGALSLEKQDYENPRDAGRNNGYEVTVTAIDADSNSATAALTVTVIDVQDDQTEMLLKGVANFGQTVNLNVLDAVGQRLGGNFNPDDSSATLGGRRLNLSGGRSVQPDAFGALRDEADMTYELQSTSLREFLLASAFHLSVPGADQGGRWSAWARGATASVTSGDGRSSFSVDVSTAVLGADYESGPMLAGMAAAYSESSGEAEEENGGASAGVNSSLTSAHPYLKFNVNERLSVWGVLGYGKGKSWLTAAGRERVETDIEMKMGAFGARRELSPLGDYGLAVESDVYWMRVNSEAAPGLGAASADANRLRLRLETSRRHELASGALLTPELELGLRHDGGDVETGAGLELGGRLLYTGADRRLALDANVRALIVHADREYKERGFGGSVRLKPNRWGHGLSLNLSSSWGDAASGIDDLWSRRPTGGADAGSARRLDIEIGYGMNGPGGGVLTSYVGAALPDGGSRAYRSGWRLALKPSLNLSLEASARETVGDALEHGLMLRAELSVW